MTASAAFLISAAVILAPHLNYRGARILVCTLALASVSTLLIGAAS